MDAGIAKWFHEKVMGNCDAIKELQKQNEAQSKQIEALEIEVKRLRKLIMNAFVDLDSE